jgi:hypothetical protein
MMKPKKTTRLGEAAGERSGEIENPTGGMNK